MSANRLSLTCAKLEELGIPYKLGTSPNTGRLAAWVQTIPPVMIDHQQYIADADAFKAEATRQLTSEPNNLDAYCDDVAYVQNVLTDTYYPSVWAAVDVTAEGELGVLRLDGEIGSLVLFEILIFAIQNILLSNAFWAVLGLIVITIAVWIFTHPPQAKYTIVLPDGTFSIGTWTEQLTKLNGLYWYVCTKDLYAVGLKSQYASPSAVPADQIALFNDHCAGASDISPKEPGMPDMLQWILIAAVGLGGVYLAVKILPSLIKSKD